MDIDYNAVIEILKNFINNEKTEILGISVGEERQVRDAIKNLLTAYEKEKVSRKVMQDNWSQNVKLVEELKAELEKEKEKNSKLLEALDTVNHEKGVFIESYEREKEKNKEKIIYWLDRLDLEEELQNEYDELYGCQAVVKMLKQLLKEE